MGRLLVNHFLTKLNNEFKKYSESFTYPFSESGPAEKKLRAIQFIRECEDGTMNKNPRRMAWIEQRIEELNKELQQEK